MLSKYNYVMKCVEGIIFGMVVVMFLLGLGTEIDRKAYAADAGVCLDGKMIAFPDQQPIIDANDRILVPLRFPAQELGATVDWLIETRQVRVTTKNHATLPDSDILLTIGKKEATVNGEIRVMDTTAVIMGERTMVPLRFISEFMGATVKWEGNAKIAFIFTQGQTAEEREQIISVKTAIKTAPADKINNIKILTYHEITPLPEYADENIEYLYVEPAIFQQHLDILKKNGYNTVTLRDLYEHWEHGQDLPANPIVLTFDDGYRSMYDFVMPELIKRDMVGTFFIITDKFNHPGYVNETMIREMHKNGMEIASHSHSHCDLRNADLEKELNQSKKLLENIIADTVYSFCYPYGLYNAKTINYLAQCEYKIAVTVNYGEASIDQNIYALKRIKIDRGDQIENFIKKIESKYP